MAETEAKELNKKTTPRQKRRNDKGQERRQA